MEINKDIRSGNKSVDAYIEALEGWIEELSLSNIYRLIKSCDEMAGIVADDVVKLGSDKYSDDELDGELQMLGSKGNKRYERFLATLKQLKDFKLADDILQELKPKKALKQGENPKGKKVEEVVEPMPSMQDLVIKKNGKA